MIAVTMGDGAGIGPEVIVAALNEFEGETVVVGDAWRLEQAAEIMNVPPPRNVEDLDLLPRDLAWGELSAQAGDAAYRYIERAVELEAQAICTAPLNKAALHRAGHDFPGHTELLAHLTGTPEVSMMLSSPRLNVIHVTTHLGLIDAIDRIEPGLVERTIRRGHEALGNPRIGVCAINPHAGENGAFGRGEEETKIAPAVEAARKTGIDVRGPLPADTAFFLAQRGDFDLIVAMYHDQGHAPFKVLGIDSGVNITVGLPVIRTSVDHGTAFDIAGTGKADHRSMLAALQKAANFAH